MLLSGGTLKEGGIGDNYQNFVVQIVLFLIELLLSLCNLRILATTVT